MGQIRPTLAICQKVLGCLRFISHFINVLERPKETIQKEITSQSD